MFWFMSLQVLTEYVVQDLNLNPELPFEDDSFDIITNVVGTSFPSQEYFIVFSF